MLHNAHPKRNLGSAKRGDTSEAKSGKPINVVHMSSTFAPSLTTAIIFRCLGSHDCYRKKRSSFANGRKKKTGRGSGLPVLTKEMQGGNINALDHRAINLIHLTK